MTERAVINDDYSQKTLRTLLEKRKVIVCVGSGGVGKTTTAAALAIGAARSGRRAAVLTIDPAKRLAQALGIEKMGNTPSKLDQDLTAPGTVHAMMLETGEAFDELIGQLVPDVTRRDRLLQNRLYQVLARHLGGTHEYMAVEKLYELSRSDDYDLVIVDTPPSVNALDFLDAPQRIASFFSDKIQRFFIRRHEESKKGILQRLKDRAGEMAVGILGKALGESFIEDVQDFATAFQGLFGAFRERGVAIEALLSDPGTAFLIVTGADPIRVREAHIFADTLAGMRIEPQAFVANRVHLEPDAVELPSADALAATLGDDAETVRAGLARAAEIRTALCARDAAGLSQMRARSDRVLVVPELDDEVGDRGAVEHLLRALGVQGGAKAS